MDEADCSPDSQKMLSRFIATIFNVVELTGTVDESWLTIILSPIFKNKVDPAKVLSPGEISRINIDLAHWREVAQADALTTLYGSCVLSL